MPRAGSSRSPADADEAPAAPDPRTSVDFAPVPIRSASHHRGPDRVVLAAIAVAFALVVAVLKPWDAGPGAISRAPRPSPGATAGAVAVPPLDSGDSRTSVAILRALAFHDAWGIGVVSADPGPRPMFAESWQRAAPGEVVQIAPLLVTSASEIAAIRITAPSTETPLDVRVWARGHDGEWHWLEVGRFTSDRADADLLLPPPVVDGRFLPAWPSGRYRFDLLMGGYVTRIDLSVGPGAENADAPVTVPSLAPVVAGSTADPWPGGIPLGPFAIADGVGRPVIARAGDPMTAAEAWLAGDAIARIDLPRTTGLGVMLRVSARAPAGVIRRLSPDAAFDGPVATVGVRLDTAGIGRTVVQFDQVAAGRFEPGVYALELSWDGFRGRESAIWHIELGPGPLSARPPPLLRAARRYADFAGNDALILSGGSRRDPDPGGPPVSAFPLVETIGCDRSIIRETPEVLGIGHQADDAPSSIRATIEGPTRRTIDLRLRIAPGVVPGLTLVAPARAATFAPGIYRFTMDGRDGPTGFTVCLGASPTDG